MGWSTLKVGIVIPTIYRSEFLVRQLRYYAKVGCDHSIYIGDSSQGLHADQLQEAVHYLETYRDAERLGSDRKSLVLRVVLRKADGTLTGEEADAIRDRIVSQCEKAHGATLRA